jgi:biopolymer transport protein TolR
MAEVTETGDRKSLNVALNIVPFIDLMSCMTAFLLVTAVWVSLAQVDVRPKGKTRDGPLPVHDNPTLSVLIEPDEIWIGVSPIHEFERIPTVGDGHDWRALEQRLAAHKTSLELADTRTIEIAAGGTPDRPITYQALVTAMDLAVKVGFDDIGVTDPRGLSAYPHL